MFKHLDGYTRRTVYAAMAVIALMTGMSMYVRHERGHLVGPLTISQHGVTPRP